MKRAISKHIPQAIKLIKSEGISKDEKTVPNVFKGYISSFGASMVTTGLVPTLIFFADEDGGAKDRHLIIPILEKLVFEKNEHKKLVDHALQLLKDNDQQALRNLKRKILDAAIALKLALRTFRFSESPKTTNDEN